ncbi:uncharacterized protein LOC133146488 isoform X4 [Syngnathus typhle]|uniref:uncharacterized protein LOC133146488 isoform X4 n=1 Tax=Syngnathus typhle TaxID=161592 RepID=UPI002A6AB2E1|nr:uncharacterized protein LOC133146488 isoform X4 [Syngnathus typhle]
MDAFINKTKAEVTLLKALRFGVLLLLGAYIFCWNKDCIESHHLFFKELTHKKQTHSHGRVKRNAIGNGSAANCSTQSVDIFLSINNPRITPIDLVNQLRNALENVLLPFNITEDLMLVESLNLTTACYKNSTGGYQCHCEEELLWSEDICDTFGACNAQTQTCDCVNGIPFEQFCKPRITTPSTQQITATVDIVLTLSPPQLDDNLQPLDIVDLLRSAVDDVSVQFEIADNLTLTSWNLTTACYPNSTGGRHKCQCEDLFRWSCDICETFDTCSNDSTPTCDCILGIPSFGQFCEPISILHPCPPQITEATVDIVLRVTPPPFDDDLQPLDIIDLLRAAVDNVSVPFEIADDLTLTSWNLTTACYPNSTGGRHKCQCEDLFRWSCDICATSDTCSNDSTPTCDCILGIPSFGQFCEPISILPPCQHGPEVTVDIVLRVTPPPFDDDLQPLDIIDLLRAAVDNVSVPFEIADDLTLTSWNLTTACYPNSTGGRHKCQCEDLFRWSCDICATSDTCSNDSTPTCDCILGIPSFGQFCEPISIPPLCDPQMTEATVDIVLTLSPPQLDDDLQPLDVIALLRAAVADVSVLFEIADNLILTSWNLTTACYPNSTGGRECQCEDSFGWTCDICDTFDTCSNTMTPTCDCIFGIPPSGEYCEPVSFLPPCQHGPEVTVDIVLRVTPPPFDDDLQPLDIIDLLRAAVDNVSVPFEIADDLTLTSWNLTTACYPNSTGGRHKCQCEDLFRWSCDICATSDTCSNDSTPTCDCILGIPSFGQFCEPISILPPCQHGPEVTVDIVLRVTPPPFDDDLQPLDIIDLLRAAVDNVSVPFEIADDLTLTSWNLTTACYPNSTGGRHKCQCEDLFRWSCDICATSDTCSNDSTPTCDCILGIPSFGQFCEPISIPPLCDPQMTEATVDIVLTLSPPQLDDDLQPLDVIALLRAAVADVSVLFEIADNLILTSWNLTTACYPNSTGGRECQCEDSFGWTCDICDTFDTCSNTMTPTCDCIFGIPPSGEYCEPVSFLPPCQHGPEVTVDIVLRVTPPPFDDDLQPLDIIDLLRAAVDNVSVPFEIADDLTLTSWNLTTACYPNSTGGRHKCQCEDLFRWSCDICATSDTCSNDSTPTCDCILGIPSFGQFCEPISIPPLCDPQMTEATVDIVLTLSPPQLDDDLQPLDVIALLRAAVADVSVLFEIADNLILTSWNLTTACYPNSTGGRECQCEDSFGWTCDICDTFDTCSNTMTPTCDCIFGIPPSGEYCEPVSSLSPCPEEGIVLLYNLCCKLTLKLVIAPTCHIMGRKVILLSLSLTFLSPQPGFE